MHASRQSGRRRRKAAAIRLIDGNMIQIEKVPYRPLKADH
jgi:hypothetical protein